jgi:predicted ArsR family transcriptional regulator
MRRNEIYVRKLTDEEKKKLKTATKSREAMKAKRSIVLLKSNEGKGAIEIGKELNYTGEGVRNIIKAFNERGLESLERQSNRPKSAHPEIDKEKSARLLRLLQSSPTNYGHEHQKWTLDLLATVAYEKGVTERVLSRETIRLTIKRLGLRWQQIKVPVVVPDKEPKSRKTAAAIPR